MIKIEMRDSTGRFVKGYTYKQTKEHKRKIGLSKLGKKRPLWVCLKLSKAKKGKYLGKEAGHWKGGKSYTASGHLFIYKPQHPYATKDGYVMEHRLVIENKIGRYLTKNEIVHHINDTPDDNRIENLILMDKKQHNTIHHKGKKRNGLRGQHIGWTSWYCPIKNCNKIIYNTNLGSKEEIENHLKDHTIV